MNVTEILEKLNGIISRPILFGIFGLICIAFAVSSLVLLFHWNRYAIDKSAVFTTQVVYFLGGALIILIGFVSVVLY